MTISKFGRYLPADKNSSSSSSSYYSSSNQTYTIKAYRNTVDCENRILRNVREGVLKNDVVTKKQLEDNINFCVSKIKNVSKTLTEIQNKLGITADVKISKPESVTKTSETLKSITNTIPNAVKATLKSVLKPISTAVKTTASLKSVTKPIPTAVSALKTPKIVKIIADKDKPHKA